MCIMCYIPVSFIRGIQVLVDGAHCLGSVDISMRYVQVDTLVLLYEHGFIILATLLTIHAGRSEQTTMLPMDTSGYALQRYAYDQ